MIGYRSSTVRPPQSRNFSKVYESKLEVLNSSRAVYTETKLPSTPENHHFNVVMSMVAGGPPTGNKYDDFINELHSIARIATTMYLEVGLISGAVPVDDVIGELLRMGSVTLKVLESLKLDDFTKATEQYGKLGKALNGDDAVKAAEEEMLLRENMRKAAIEVGDVEKLPGADEYKKKLEEVEHFKGIDSGPLNTYTKDLKKLINGLSEIETMNSDTDESRASSDRMTFEVCMVSIGHLGANHAVVSSLAKQVAALKAIDTEPKYLKPLFNEINAEKQFKDSNFKKTVNTTGISDNLNVLNSANAIYQTGQAMVGHVKEVMTARNSGTYSVVHLYGYPNGISDLVKAVADASAEWIQKAVNGTGEASQSLVNSFEPIGNFTEATNNLDQPLKAAEGAEKVQKMEQVHEKFKQLGTPQELSQGFIDIAECSGDTDKNPFADANIKASKQKMDDFSTKLSRLSSFENVSKFNLDELKGNLTFHKTTDAEKNKEAIAMIKALRGSDFISNTVTKLENYQKDLNDLKTFLDGRDAAVTEIKKEMGKVETEKNGMVNHPYRKLFACLQNAASDLKEVQKQIDLIRNVRDSKMSDVMQEVAKMMGLILLNLDSAIKKARNAGSSMKGLKNKETNKLMAAMEGKKIEEISKNLGTAVKGMNTIVELKKIKESMKPLLEDVTFIVKEAGNWGLSKEDDDVLKAFGDVTTQLTEMYVGIDKVIGLIDKRNSENNQDYRPAMTEAAKLKSVTLDIGKLIGTLERLEKVMKTGQTGKGVQKRAANNLLAVISALKKLAPLNLSFAGYNFNSASTALADLLTIIGNYFPNLSTGVPAGLPPVSSVIATTPRDDSGWMANNYLYILIGVGVPCVIGVIGLLIYWSIRGFPCSKKKSSVENNDLENIGTPGTGPDDPKNTKNTKKPKPTSKRTKKKQTPKEPKEPENQEKVVIVDENRNGEDLPVEPTVYPEPSQAPENVTTAQAQPPTLPDPAPPEENQRVPRRVQPGNLAPAVNPKPPAPAPPRVPTQKEYLSLIRGARSVLNGNFEKNYTPYGWTQQLYIQLFYDTTVLDEHLTERRYGKIGCRDATRVRIRDFGNDYINASTMEFGQITWIMAQGPLDGTEEGKISTMEKHWAMIDQYDVGAVAQLSALREADRKERVKRNKVDEDMKDPEYVPPPPEAPEKPAPVVQVCGEYYPQEVGQTKKFGRYTIEMTELVTVPDTFTVNRELFKVMKMKYTNSRNPGNEVKHVTIVQFSGWPTDKAPPSPYNALQLIRYCDSFEKNVLVVCSDGADRSGCLVAMKYGSIESKKGAELNPLSFFTKLRGRRNGLMNKSHNVYFTYITITREVMDFLEARNPSISPMFCEEYEQFVFYAETAKETGNWGEREKFDEIIRGERSKEKNAFLKNRNLHVNTRKKELDTLRELNAAQEQQRENQEQRTSKTQELSVSRVRN